MSEINIHECCIESGSTIRQAMQSIGRGQYGVVFVTESTGRFITMFTDGDIRRALLAGHGLESRIDVIQDPTPVVVSVDTSQDVISSLFSEKIRVIPVIDHEGRVVDIHYHDKRTHIAVTEPLFDDEEVELVNECIISGWVSSGGPFVQQFEEMVAANCGVKYAVSCSSATSGLHLALLAYGIGAGDEVIVPSLTFIATANAVTYTGARPVFIDSEIDTWNIDPNSIEAQINDNTKAIIPVHLYGHPADMDIINDIARQHDLVVIEDAAEAQGALYKGKKVGSLADLAVFSFFGNKIITTGEGGMVVTNDKEIADRCRILRDHGMSPEKRYWHDVIGYNYRMTNIQAALGVAQLGKIDQIISRKKAIAAEYEKHLKGITGITLPSDSKWADNVYWLYTVLIDEHVAGCSRDRIIELLKSAGIDSRPVFPPVHTQPVYRSGQDLPVSERISSVGISLPSSPDIKDIDIKRVCSLIVDIIKS